MAYILVCMDIFNNITLNTFAPLIKSVAILVIAYFLSRIASKFVGRIVKRTVPTARFKTKKDEMQREQTLTSIISATVTIVIWATALLIILSSFSVDIAPILASAGVLGVALGFGAQSMVKDFLAGLFILLENQYRVGDVLQVNQGVAGVVEKITLRVTTLRDLDGKVHYIPNGNIDVATNMTLEFSSVDVNVGVAYDSDIDKVEKVVNQVGQDIFEDEKWQGVVLEPAKMLRVDSLGDSSINIKIVCKTAPIHQWEVKSEILRRLKKAFDKAGIEIPFPQRVVHMPKQSNTK